MMDRKEKILVACIILFVIGQVCVFEFTDALHYFNGAIWFGVGANLIQWSSLFSTEFAIIAAIWMYWHRRCGVPFCIRTGEHPVDGTLAKICNRHHTKEHHERVFHLFKHKHKHLLSRGESHNLEK